MIRTLSLQRGYLASPHRNRHGFTLVELLVVIVVIAILAAMILPTVGKARAKGQGAACINHQRQLMAACLLYVDDHSGRYPYNLGVSETLDTIANRTYLNWINNVMTWELDDSNTNAVLVGAGGLGPYLSAGAALYRCPSDHVLSDLQRKAGWARRNRSISMNAMIGNAGEFTSNGTNVNNPAYRQFFRASEILESARIFVFVEEHPDSINDAYFLNRPQTHEWIDLPAAYHGDASNLAFADGHVERHRWLYSSTKPPRRPGAAMLPSRVPEDELGDFYWLMDRMSRKTYIRPGPPRE